MANLVRVIEEFNNETETKILWISFDLSIDLKTLFTPRLENISFIKVDNTIAVNLKNPDFREFFNDWVYNQGYPTYSITAQNWGVGQAKFVINQTQSDPSVSYLEMPVPVRIYGALGQQADIILNNTFNGEQIITNVLFPIVSVAFDPERHLIAAATSSVTLGNQIFDLQSAV